MKKVFCLLILLAVVYAGVIIGSDEITVTTTLNVENGNYKVRRSVNNYKVDQLTNAADSGIISVAVGVTNTLSIPNVTKPYYSFFRNLDDSNTVFVTLVMELRAGDVALLPLATNNVTYYTLTGTNRMEFWVNEE